MSVGLVLLSLISSVGVTNNEQPKLVYEVMQTPYAIYSNVQIDKDGRLKDIQAEMIKRREESDARILAERLEKERQEQERLAREQAEREQAEKER